VLQLLYASSAVKRCLSGVSGERALVRGNCTRQVASANIATYWRPPIEFLLPAFERLVNDFETRLDEQLRHETLSCIVCYSGVCVSSHLHSTRASSQLCYHRLIMLNAETLDWTCYSRLVQE
jgi:hypothetical protein